jgi:hypothetical protein
MMHTRSALFFWPRTARPSGNQQGFSLRSVAAQRNFRALFEEAGTPYRSEFSAAPRELALCRKPVRGQGKAGHDRATERLRKSLPRALDTLGTQRAELTRGSLGRQRCDFRLPTRYDASPNGFNSEPHVRTRTEPLDRTSPLPTLRASAPSRIAGRSECAPCSRRAARKYPKL